MKRTDHEAPRSLRRLFSTHVGQPIKHGAAKLGRKRSRAEFVCITGSSGKSTTAMLLAHVLAGHAATESQVMANTRPAIERFLRRLSARTRFAVVETGVGRKGDMDVLSALVRPTVAVVTLVNREHYSSFRGRDGVAEEKGKLVAALPPGGLAVLNADDDLVAAMAGRTAGRVVTLGRHAPADYRVTAGFPRGSAGLAVSVEGPRGIVALQTRFLAEHFWLACAAAAVTALELGVPAGLVAERIESFAGMRDRFSIFETKSGPRFVLDTVKAPWDTLFLSFEAFARLEGGVRRIVLGQISDFAGNPTPKYRDAYQRAAACADQVIFVGENAHRSRADAQALASGRFMSFPTVQGAADYLRGVAGADDLILLKGSRNLHMERIALAWDHDVRCRNDHCGMSGGCHDCGLYEHPFADHARLRKQSRSWRWLRRGMDA